MLYRRNLKKNLKLIGEKMKKDGKILLIGILISISTFLLCYIGSFTWLYIDAGIPALLPLTADSIMLIIGCFCCLAFAISATYLVSTVYRIIWPYYAYKKTKI